MSEDEQAELLASLAQLWGALRRVGGYTSPEHQEAMRAARALLEKHGALPAIGRPLVAAPTPDWANDPPPWTKEK